MEKQISFSGVALTPYNDISPDGQLSACCNLERHAGSLRPAIFKGTSYSVGTASLKLVFIHSTANYRHFIFTATNALYWSDVTEGDMDTVRIGNTEGVVKAINAIGNTLVVSDDSGIRYYVFNAQSQNYTDLGAMPEVSLSFGLTGGVAKSSEQTISVEQINTSIFQELSDNNQTLVTNHIISRVNELISENTSLGRFIFPFFVRYALRMADGKLTRHSAPILMLCVNRNVYVVGTYDTGQGSWSQLTTCVTAGYFTLDYQCTEGATEIRKWKDVVKSVDVFISQPIYSFYPDKKCQRISNTDMADTYFSVCRLLGSSDTTNYRKWSYTMMYSQIHGGFDSTKYLVELPYKQDDEIAGEIRTCANFYLVKSIPIDSLATSRQSLGIEGGVLNNLVFQEQMTDDYYSHDDMLSDSMSVYNKRLNLANVDRRIFRGFNTESLFCLNNYSGSDLYINCVVIINEDGRDIIVRNECKVRFNDKLFYYFFYPNVNAYKVYIGSSGPISLTPHPFLNGAFAFLGFTTPSGSSYSGSISTDDERIVHQPNKIYTSEVGNPFYFPLAGVNTVGIGEIVGLASVTAALSQGQYGYFPLMAFCTDGNYALKVNDEGLFSNVSPMTRDVCINAASITPIDGAIVFVSSRGVMIADGSVINCISDILNGVQDDLSFVEGVSAFAYALPEGAPIDFFRTCMIAYDYAGRRLIFFSKEINNDSVWVLSLEDNTWSQTEISGVVAVLNSYPYSYIQKDGGSTIVRLDEAYQYADADSYQGIIVTRPLKLDTLQYKSLRQVALVGSFSRSQTVGIYGSNDGNNWFHLGKSNAGRILTPGRYFKYYRFSVETDLDNSENITGLRIEYDVRPERRFR